jgi:hypothetical protein
MFGFLLFRNLTNSGAAASVILCGALGYVWIVLDDKEKETKQKIEFDKDQRARFLRRINQKKTTEQDNTIGPFNKN